VLYILDRESLLTTSVSEKLRKLVNKLSTLNTYRSGKGLLNDSVAYLLSKVTAPKMIAIMLIAFLGPISIFYLLSFGLIVVSFRYWYTLI
jgi:hypothetical protein